MTTQKIQAQALRIDAKVAPVSRYEFGLYALMIVGVAGLSVLARLPVWQYLLLLLVLALSVGLVYLSRIPLIHITQPKLSRHLYHGWQLLLQTSHQRQLWQANLLAAQDYGLAVMLKFAVMHPQQKVIYRMIYCDQVSTQAWHQLKILVNLVTPRH